MYKCIVFKSNVSYVVLEVCLVFVYFFKDKLESSYRCGYSLMSD